jgi:hypothetical protein
MSSMTRQLDIAALLTKAEQQLVDIMKEYDASLHAKTIHAALKVEIKNYCENLRSVLDYLAHGIREKYCPSENPKDIFYFPITPDVKQFTGQVARSYPGLQNANVAVWNALEKCQPYQPNCVWLGHLSKVNNENKHGALVAQERHETEQVKADFSSGSVSWNPAQVRFGSGVRIGGVPVDPSTQLPVANDRLKVTKTTWVDFHFQGIGVSAIALLRDALPGVKAINAALTPHL